MKRLGATDYKLPLRVRPAKKGKSKECAMPALVDADGRVVVGTRGALEAICAAVNQKANEEAPRC